MTMAGVALLFVLFLTSLLTNMPVAVLAGIVFMIGLGLVDVAGLRRIRRQRVDEFVIACVTGVVVFAIGVEQGIVLAVVLSLLDVIRRAYHPGDFVVGQGPAHNLDYSAAKPGAQSRPGLVIFRFDASLFYANATRLTDDIKAVVEGAPTPVRWMVLDCSSVDDVDYSAGLELAHPDDALLATLRTYGVLDHVARDRIFSTVDEVFVAWTSQTPASVVPGELGPPVA